MSFSSHREGELEGRGKEAPRPSRATHRLSNIDPVAQVAMCAIDGFVEVRLRHRGNGDTRLACRTKLREMASLKPTRQRRRQADRFRQYGLTAEMFEAYLDAQEGACGYCGGELSENRSHIAIDHDHVTGHFRSLTHLWCNSAIGGAEKHFIGYMAAH